MLQVCEKAETSYQEWDCSGGPSLPLPKGIKGMLCTANMSCAWVSPKPLGFQASLSDYGLTLIWRLVQGGGGVVKEF